MLTCYFLLLSRLKNDAQCQEYWAQYEEQSQPQHLVLETRGLDLGAVY